MLRYLPLFVGVFSSSFLKYSCFYFTITIVVCVCVCLCCRWRYVMLVSNVWRTCSQRWTSWPSVSREPRPRFWELNPNPLKMRSGYHHVLRMIAATLKDTIPDCLVVPWTDSNCYAHDGREQDKKQLTQHRHHHPTSTCSWHSTDTITLHPFVADTTQTPSPYIHL